MPHLRRTPFLLCLLGAILGAPTAATAQLRVLERAQHTAIDGFETLPANLGYYDRSRGTVVVHGAGANQATWEWSGEGEFARSGTTQVLQTICAFPGQPGKSLGFRALTATVAVRSLGQWSLLPGPGPSHTQQFGTPLPRANLTLDEGRDRAVLVFSRWPTQQQVSRETWEFDGQTWTLVPTNTPANGAMFFHLARQRVQLVDPAGTVFEWNGATWSTWTSGPLPGQILQAASYDRGRHRIVTASSNSSTTSTFLHEWDGSQWTQVWVESVYPPQRLFAAMVYDETHRLTVAIGRAYPANRPVMWTWDGAQLLERTPSTVRPSPRNDAMLAEDSTRGAILFGGRDGNNVPNAETWLWDGTTWSNLNEPTGPSARSAGAMARAGNGRVYLFGGLDGNGTALGDTWELLPPYGWSQISTGGTMPARLNHALVCDLGAAGRLYLFGGSNGTQWFGDLRRFDSSTFPAQWVVVTNGTGPQPRDLHGLATDEARRKLVLFGGRNAAQTILADTWEFDLGTQTWSQRLPLHIPPNRGNHALVYDRTRQRTLLFGGSGPGGNFWDDIWEWDGIDWIRRALATGSIAATENPAACFDGRTQRTVVFGGQSTGATDATYELVEPDGPAALRQQVALAMTVTSLPVVHAGQCTPLGVQLDSSGGLSALFLGFGTVPAPYAIGQLPLFCSQQDLHVPGLVSYLGIGLRTEYSLPLPAFAAGLLLSMQGIALSTNGCLDATEARLILVQNAP